MSSAELRPKLLVGAAENKLLSIAFPPNGLFFCKNQASIFEQLNRPESALLLLPAMEASSHLLTQKIRKDRYLENFPVVYFSDQTLSLEEQELACSFGVSDFFVLTDPSLPSVQRRILNLATLYWKLKKENTQTETDSLAESVKFLDSLIEYLPNMVFVKDAKDLRFVRFNRAGENLLGYKREDLIGKNDYDFFPKDQADHFTQKDRAVLSSAQLLDIPEEPIHTKDGLRILHTRKIPLYDEKGNPTFLLGISEDITEVKKAEHEKFQLVKEQAARLEAEKGIAIRDEFISIASHELKTPLTSLDLQFQIVKRWFAKKDYSIPSLEKLQKIFQDSFLQVQKLGVLLEDLLDVSRAQRGDFSYNFETVDIMEVIEGAASRLNSQARAMGSEIVWGTKESCVVSCDPFRLDQALTNLIVNSIKYGQGTPIRISIEAKGDCAELLISDSGIGIAPENQEKIFERFARAVSFKSISGMGLGLFITKEIVEAHKGTIEVESALGKGASFKVRIPLKNE